MVGGSAVGHTRFRRVVTDRPRALAYSKFRPRYPRALFHYLATITNDNRSAWDVGTGNGQAAIAGYCRDGGLIRRRDEFGNPVIIRQREIGDSVAPVM